MYDQPEGTGPIGIQVQIEGRDAAVFLTGELDLRARQPFWWQFSRLAEHEPGRIILDLSGLEFVDAAGLGVFSRAHDLVGDRLILRNPSPSVWRILKLTGVDRRIPVQLAPGKVAYVRNLWEAFQEGGATAVAELVPDGVEWMPWDGEGRVLRGSREMRNFWAPHATHPAEAVDFTQVGGDVVIELALPLPTGQRRELWSVYHFDGDRLVQAVTLGTRVQAMEFAV